MAGFNQFAIFWGMKCAVPLMTLGGSIINLSSIGGMAGYKGTFAYAGTKWAVRGLTRWSEARELSPLSIRVNSVCPGVIDTPMMEAHATVAWDFPAVLERPSQASQRRRRPNSA
jgi:3alpha(or 20beta)-hydroxysteroid dehydrogenase